MSKLPKEYTYRLKYTVKMGRDNMTRKLGWGHNVDFSFYIGIHGIEEYIGIQEYMKYGKEE